MASTCKEAIITRPKQIDAATPEEKHRDEEEKCRQNLTFQLFGIHTQNQRIKLTSINKTN